MRNVMAEGMISFRFFESALNCADILTKPMSPTKFSLFLKKILMKWKVQDKLKER